MYANIGVEMYRVEVWTLKIGKHYLFTIVANHCQGGWCIFWKESDIIHHLYLVHQVWNQAFELWGWIQPQQGEGLVAS